MQPEDIDKLFRDRLEGHAPTPPDYLWSQLQQEIQPASKRPAMWLYAAAAAVALLLLVGGSWLLLPGSTTNGTLATTHPTRPATSVEQPTLASEKSTDSQATASAELASTTSNAPDQEADLSLPGAPAQMAPVVVARAERPVTRQAVARAVVQKQSFSESSPAPAAVAVSTPHLARPERPVAVETPETAVAALPKTLAAAPVAAPTGPIVVEVRREVEIPVIAVAETPDEQPRRTRLGAVLRQARNAVKGDPVDLGKVGLPEALTVQARVGGHTLTKTIEL